MKTFSQRLILAVTAAIACAATAAAQIPATGPAILEIDTENYIEYENDANAELEPTKIGTNPNIVVPASPTPPFGRIVGFADIVAVNGKAAKGLVSQWEVVFVASPTPNPGAAIADVPTLGTRLFTFQILQSDGTRVGTIMTMGMSQNGSVLGPPPGAPLAQTGQELAIVGGTGAFLGARGQQGQERTPMTVNPRVASMLEDPSRRRINGGGTVRFIFQLFPMSRPQIAITANGPAVTHSSDFSLVTPSNPAAAGEILSVFATGLGPTRPGVDAGQPFPSNSTAVVNSPVEVTVNGKTAQVLAAVGYPSSVDGYQVNFRVPPDTAKGTATIQLSAAWIASPAVSVAIQ